MHRPSWMRRHKKPDVKAEASRSSNTTSLASSVSNLVLPPDPEPNTALSVPQDNGQSRGSLWDKAYEDLKTEKKDLVDDLEKLLLSEPEIESTSTLADGDTSKREKHMSALVAKKLESMETEQWKLRIGGKSVEVRQQVDRIVKVVLVAKDFVTSAASMDPIHAGLPWAGVCMLLPLMTKDSKQRTAATDGLEFISGLIRRYTQIEQIYLSVEDFPIKADLQNSITKLYKHILEYEARAACQFNRNTAHQWVRNVVELDSWKTIIGSIKDLEAACDKLTWIIDANDQRVRTTRLESYLQHQNHEVRELFRISREQEEEQGKLQLAELKAGSQEQKDWHSNAEESACYECLRTTDYESNKNKNPKRILGTCEWFLRHPRYRKWLDEQGSTWLWVTADPGCGKSVLSRFLVDEYKQGMTDTNTVCYYFFKDDSEEGRSATHALCAILHQLFSQNNKLLRHAIPAYKRNGSKLSGLFHELWDIFLSAATDPDAGSIVCILDALDECAESTRLPIIRVLARYYQYPEVTTRLKFIVVSRPYASIGDVFLDENPDVASVQLMGESEAETEAIRLEIDLVIAEKVKHFNSRRLRKGVDDDAHIAVQEQLRSIENRTYLWVSLIFPELEKKAGLAKSKLLQLIKIIPKSVDDAYERILNQSSDREQAKKLLHIVVAAKRPLELAEMNIALSMEEGITSIEDLELEPEPSFPITVRELCGLLVVIRDSHVYLIHQTAKEFLLAGNIIPNSASVFSGLDPWRHSIEPAKSDHVLAMICISYLSIDVFESDPLRIKDEDRKDEKYDRLESNSDENDAVADQAIIDANASNSSKKSAEYSEKRSFMDYAAGCWSLHLSEADSLDDPATLKAALGICASHPRRLWMWFPKQWDMKIGDSVYPGSVTDLMIGSFLGLEGMIKSCLAQGAEINSKDTALGWAPLMFATGAGHEAVVKILLANGAEVNAQERDESTALIWAVRSNNENMVKTLLEHNADPNLQDEEGDTPLNDAVKLKQETIGKMLLAYGADSNHRNKNGETPLILAAWKGNETLGKMLLAYSADVNSQDKVGMTALMCAAYMANETIVKMLLESSAKPDVQDQRGDTALMGAGRWGYKKIVKMLLEYGADPNTQDENGDSALIEAALYGYGTRMEMLLQHNADPNLQNHEGSTALILTVYKMPTNETIVKMLLRQGADLTIRDKRGNTALMLVEEEEARLKKELKLDIATNTEINDSDTAELVSKIKSVETILNLLLEHEAERTEKARNSDENLDSSSSLLILPPPPIHSTPLSHPPSSPPLSMLPSNSSNTSLIEKTRPSSSATKPPRREAQTFEQQ